jgi:hypothetical protein
MSSLLRPKKKLESNSVRQFNEYVGINLKKKLQKV